MFVYMFKNYLPVCLFYFTYFMFRTSCVLLVLSFSNSYMCIIFLGNRSYTGSVLLMYSIFRHDSSLLLSSVPLFNFSFLQGRILFIILSLCIYMMRTFQYFLNLATLGNRCLLILGNNYYGVGTVCCPHTGNK